MERSPGEQPRFDLMVFIISSMVSALNLLHAEGIRWDFDRRKFAINLTKDSQKHRLLWRSKACAAFEWNV